MKNENANIDKCEECNNKLFIVGGTENFKRAIRIKGVGRIELNLVSYRCSDHLNCDGGHERSDHQNSKYFQELHGHIFSQEGKYLGQKH